MENKQTFQSQRFYQAKRSFWWLSRNANIKAFGIYTTLIIGICFMIGMPSVLLFGAQHYTTGLVAPRVYCALINDLPFQTLDPTSSASDVRVVAHCVMYDGVIRMYDDYAPIIISHDDAMAELRTHAKLSTMTFLPEYDTNLASCDWTGGEYRRVPHVYKPATDAQLNRVKCAVQSEFDRVVEFAMFFVPLFVIFILIFIVCKGTENAHCVYIFAMGTLCLIPAITMIVYASSRIPVMQPLHVTCDFNRSVVLTRTPYIDQYNNVASGYSTSDALCVAQRTEMPREIWHQAHVTVFIDEQYIHQNNATVGVPPSELPWSVSATDFTCSDNIFDILQTGTPRVFTTTPTQCWRFNASPSEMSTYIVVGILVACVSAVAILNLAFMLIWMWISNYPLTIKWVEYSGNHSNREHRDQLDIENGDDSSNSNSSDDEDNGSNAGKFDDLFDQHARHYVRQMRNMDSADVSNTVLMVPYGQVHTDAPALSHDGDVTHRV